MRRDRLRVVLWLWCAWLGLTSAISSAQTTTDAAAKTSKPNIVFIFADDLGWGDLGCYGHAQLRTPQLDRLAAGGTLFTQFYVNASVCSPSRVGVTTGRFPGRYGVHTVISGSAANKERGIPDYLPTDAPTLAKLLKQAGYATAHYGKWHLGSPNARPAAPGPEAYGFDEAKIFGGVSKAPTDGVNLRAMSTDMMVDEGIRFVEAHKDQPFFLQIWTLIPHAVLDPTPEQREPYKRYSPADLPYITPKTVYYAAVTSMDTALGRLFKRLDELKLSDNTLVVFSSDNGPEDMESGNASHSGVGSAGPFRGRKRSLYEGGVRVPFIVRWPGQVPAGKVNSESVVSGVDLLPTFAAITGAPLPAGAALDGEDISDILRGSSRARKTPLMWTWRYNIAGHPLNRSPMLSIRDGDYKLLMNPDGKRVELYHIPRDPGEVDNLASEQTEVAAKLSRRLMEWYASLPPAEADATAGTVNYPWPGTKQAARRARPQKED